ncbi:myo-inosose-2 dehydratase [Thioclava kandeliae]|uniref:Myo-inosose-2 dehydratase n=1 Tax=Thioclava kandeliae TaxID=3070818 RepID=A0ABV1SJ56_9RHOB
MGLPQGVKLGVSPLSWANDVLEDLGADIPLSTCLNDAAETGYQGIELGRKFPRDAAVLGPLLADYGLDLASGWYSGELALRGVDEELAAVGPHARLLQAMGARVMVYGEVAMMAEPDALDQPMSRRVLMSTSDRRAYAERLTRFADALQTRYGLRLAYHHHLMMVAETYEEVAEIFAQSGPELGLLLDTGHAAGAGYAYGRLIADFGQRICHIHLKDMRPEAMARVRRGDLSFNAGVRAGMFTVPGDGCIDFGPLARFVRESGYQGWLVVEAEQDPAKVPPRPAVTAAREYILSQFVPA